MSRRRKRGRPFWRACKTAGIQKRIRSLLYYEKRVGGKRRDLQQCVFYLCFSAGDPACVFSGAVEIQESGSPAVQLVFYAWGEPVYVFLMIFSIVFNYFSGLELEQRRQRGEKTKLKICFVTTVVANLAILGFFKYYGFLVTNLNRILPLRFLIRNWPFPLEFLFIPFRLCRISSMYIGAMWKCRGILSASELM